MSYFARHFVSMLSLGAVFALAGRAADPLASNSPFLPPSNSAAGPAENTPLELRGIMVDDGGYRFSVYDPVRHSGTWARLNEPGNEFIIRAHDVARDMITVDFQGRVLTLPLHTAKVVSAPVVLPQVANGRPARNPVVLNPTPADEVARFNRVKEEIARRRALREQNSKNGK